MTDHPRERGIIFTSEMVNAILDGKKTVTRRVVKGVLPDCDGDVADGSKIKFANASADGEPDDADWFWQFNRDEGCYERYRLRSSCPYGVPGDRLYVREKMRVIDRIPVSSRAEMVRVIYEADGTQSKLLPYPGRLEGEPRIGKCLSYGGYREASRINLEITDVRVERVQDISPADARAEGAPELSGHESFYEHGEQAYKICWFRPLWDSINAKREDGRYAWKKNPWIWIIAFRKLDEESRS